MSFWYSSETQIAWACRQLLKGQEISHLDEIKSVKGWRLAAIIWRLRHEFDWPIDKREGKDGVVFYRLERGVDKSKLRMPSSYRQK